ncbi:MAG: pilin [Candidatus Colwellbacteria bacterium]
MDSQLRLIISLSFLLVFLFLGSVAVLAQSQGTYVCFWSSGVCKVSNTCNSGFEPNPPCANINDQKLCNGSESGAAIERECKPVNPKGDYYCGWDVSSKTCKELASGCIGGAEPKTPCSDFNNTNRATCEGSPYGEIKRACASAIGGSDDQGGSDDTGGSQDSNGKKILIQNPLKAGTVPEILDTVANFLFTIALAFVTIMVLWGGFQILTAAGNPTQIDKGKKTLLYAVIGTVVILVAGGIANLTSNILGGGSGPSPTEIQAPSETNRGQLPSGESGQRGTKPPLNIE